ncbi:MAG: HD domain-containing protein [Erysipelotrichaceae bacterium]|nr:HD domain-containing protein [Erysipelotrichaceae bacterium]
MESLELAKRLVTEKYSKVNEHRLLHTLGVCDMANKLAIRYNVDSIKAMIAAYMHDYCKYDSFDEIEKLLTKEEIAECREYNFLYHAYGSAYMYKKLIGDDEDIFNAIYNHVFGRPNMSILEAIIMIADYIEINREYEDCIRCREILLKDGIDAAILYSLENTNKYILSKNGKLHPRQIAVYEEYKMKVGK